MDCRETQTLLTAFHDGELPVADRARVEEHLRGCPDCAALLADLARVDQAAGVPDPGPAYWDRFNARVMDRVEREADGPKVAVLRAKGGWIRRQRRYLVPAAAAAALVVMVVRYGGRHPDAPTPAVPPVVSESAAPGSSERRADKAEPESRATKKTEGTAVARRVPPPVPAKELFANVTREERGRLADRSLSAGNEEASRDRVAAPAASSQPVPARDGMSSGMQAERKEIAGATAPMTGQHVAGKAKSVPATRMAKEASPAPASPCEHARTLSAQERWKEAETAQRACLAQDRSAPAQEKGLVLLAELLDRQSRFAEADAVIADVDRRFPESRPLDLYLQRRSMVRKPPE